MYWFSLLFLLSFFMFKYILPLSLYISRTSFLSAFHSSVSLSLSPIVVSLLMNYIFNCLADVHMCLYFLSHMRLRLTLFINDHCHFLLSPHVQGTVISRQMKNKQCLFTTEYVLILSLSLCICVCVCVSLSLSPLSLSLSLTF